MLRLISVILILSLSFSSFCQDKKTLHIKRTSSPPEIDGVLDDTAWLDTDEAKGFIQFRPDVGIKDSLEIRSIVKMTYDDKAIYVSAYLYDDPSKIMKQFTSRDNFGQSDFFTVILNPNNDAQNDTSFFVFSSGTQADAIANPSIGEDFGWNAVWESAVKINDDGWTVEMKLPYRALRFSNDNIQTWGVQFHRHFRRDRSQFTWNPIDVTKGYIGLYHGELTGIENIEPPTRLSLYPFATGLANTFEGESDTEFKLGLDVKYGISENFTLDATLIPDFSQAAFDNLTLNLGPFEQTFNEQRQFFKEGVDLFSKGELFFSRRVGNAPITEVELNDDEDFVDYPNEIKVLNAVKVSGRTKKGFGVGVFNAITEKTDVVIRDTITGDTRKVIAEPFANYNILVLDKQFNKNSSISLVNTNVIREGSFRDANVTAAILNLTNKRNTYNIVSAIKTSTVNYKDSISETGFTSFLKVGKVHGNYQYSFDHDYANDKYEINDLGLQFRNNFNNFGVDFSYRTFEPTGTLNSYRIGFWANYRRLANPSHYTGNNFGGNFFISTKSLIAFGGGINFEPGKQFDYFEPRTEGRFFIYENNLKADIWTSTNYNNAFAIDVRTGIRTYFENGRKTFRYWVETDPRVRLNDKFLVIYSFGFRNTNNDRGYASDIDNDIIFGQRDRQSITNSISGSYNFNPYHSLSLTFRNNWETVEYEDDLFTLQYNGRLSKNLGYTISDLEEDPNINFSTWNLDFRYSWQFAPGSFLTALYRNQLFNMDNKSQDSYFDSLNTLLDQPMQHTFSIRMVYFIDYNDLKNIFIKKNS